MPYNQNMTTAKNQHVNNEVLQVYGNDTSAVFGFYDLFMSIKMYPAKPENERTPKSVYDYSRRISCNISREDILYYAYILEHEIIPAAEANKPIYRALQCGPNTIFFIANRIKGEPETAPLMPRFGIYKGLDDHGRPAERRYFAFREFRYITAYNPETGEIEVKNDPMRGFYVLLGLFKVASLLIGPTAHLERYLGRFRSNQQYQLINSIAGKLGVDHPINNVGGSSGPAWMANATEAHYDGGDVAIEPMASEATGDFAQLMSSSSLDNIAGLQ